MSKCPEGRRCNWCGPAAGAAHRNEKRCDPDFEDEDWSDFDEDEITGELDITAEDAWPVDVDQGEACPECNGNGYLVYDSEQDESECPVCRGTGYLSLLP